MHELLAGVIVGAYRMSLGSVSRSDAEMLCVAVTPGPEFVPGKLPHQRCSSAADEAAWRAEVPRLAARTSATMVRCNWRKWVAAGPAARVAAAPYRAPATARPLTGAFGDAVCRGTGGRAGVGGHRGSRGYRAGREHAERDQWSPVSGESVGPHADVPFGAGVRG